MLVCVALLVYHLVAGRIPEYDALTLFWPYFSLSADLARSGQLLLWNPWINCGSPDLAYVEMGSFSPLTVLFALLTGGGQAGFLLYWVFIWGIFGAGIVLLARHLGADHRIGFALAVSSMFSGFFLGNATHTSWLYAFSFLPLILWRLDRALQADDIFPAAEAGVLYGLSALAGHPAVVIGNGLFVGLWAFGRVIFAGYMPGAFPRRMLRAALGVGIMLLVAAAVLSPAYLAFFFESAGFSERNGFLSRGLAVDDNALAPSALVTLAGPYLTSLKLFNPELFPGTDPTLTCCYLGAIIPALAIAAIVTAPREGFRLWLLLIGLFFLAAALGSYLPVRGWLYDYFPPMRYFRHSGMMRAYFLFAAETLALMGSSALSQPGNSARRAWRTICWSALVIMPLLGGIFAWFILSVQHPGPHPIAAAVQLTLSWGGLACAALVAGRFENSRDVSLSVVVALALLDAVFSLLLSRPFMTIPREKFLYLETRRVSSINLFPAGFSRYRLPREVFLADFNLLDKKPVLHAYNQLSNRFHSRSSLTPLATSWSDEPVLAASAVGARRLWFFSAPAIVFPSDATFATFVERARLLGAMPLVIHPRSEILELPARGVPGPNDDAETAAIERLAPCRRLDFELVDYTPTRLALAVNPPEAGWLLVTDRWSRSWRASVNGKKTEVLGGNFLFRAVRVGPGRQTVEFEFRPFLYPYLVWLSWGSMLMVLTVSVHRFRKKR